MKTGSHKAKIAIGELVRSGAILEIQDGNHGEKHPTAIDYVECGIPFVMSRDIYDGSLNLDTCKFLEQAKADKLRTGFSRTDDVLLTHKGTVGNVAIVPRVDSYIMLTPQVTYYRVDPLKLSNRYLAYAFQHHEFQGQLANISAQSTRPYVSITTQRNLEVHWVERGAQGRIVDVLSAYDDLIHNNTQRMRILEKLAQSLYREWFVQFRFPGHETVELVNSRLGRIPEGWELKKATEAVSVNPHTSAPKETDKPHVAMDSLATDSMSIGRVGMRKGNNGSKFKNGDTLFARITPCLENGKTAFVQFLSSDSDVAIGSTEFIVLRSKTVCPEYVYLMARSNEFRDNAIKSMSGATGRQRVQEECFNKFLIAQPDEETLRRFQELTRPMFELVNNLAVRNDNLRRTRDLLLPGLLSGEIAV